MPSGWTTKNHRSVIGPNAPGEVYENAEPAGVFTKAERAALDLMDELKDQHEEAMPEVQGVFADLLNAAMSEVNWHEIAKHYIDAAVENAEAETTES